MERGGARVGLCSRWTLVLSMLGLVVGVTVAAAFAVGVGGRSHGGGGHEGPAVGVVVLQPI